jgi:hypothetical protein
LCAEASAYHTITFHDDGSVTSTGCDDIETQALRYSAMARLTKRQVTNSGCAAFVALIKHGIPIFLNQSGDTPDLGAWKSVYVRYETNKLVVAVMDETRRKRDKEFAPAFAAARKALRKTRYRPKWTKADLDAATSFLPNHDMEEGTLVAIGEHDHFTVPLQADWLETVAKAGIAVVSGKFVCGVDPENPRRVYAIGKSKTDFFVVQPYELETKPEFRLRRVA